MNTITLSITAGSGKELLQIVKELAGEPSKILTAAQPSTNGNGHAKPEPAKPEAPVKQIDNTPEPKADNGEGKKALTVEQVRAAAQVKSKTHKDAVKGLLTKYGAANLTALDAKHYDEFLNEVNAL